MDCGRLIEQSLSIGPAADEGSRFRSTVDCLIAAVCLDAGAELFHHDRDFDVLAKIADLKLYRPSTEGE